MTPIVPWTTNAFLPRSYAILEGWSFKYHNTLIGIKPSGIGNYYELRS